MPNNSSQFFNNKECEYYPCHTGIAAEDMNCLFCYCPLYKEKCAGQFQILQVQGKAVKDCSGCTWNHIPENYSKIVGILAGQNLEEK